MKRPFIPNFWFGAAAGCFGLAVAFIEIGVHQITQDPWDKALLDEVTNPKVPDGISGNVG